MTLANRAPQVVRSTAHPTPNLIFPAIITGVAKPFPQKNGRDAPTVDLDTDANCTDPGDVGNCGLVQTPDSEGFYPDEFLPCGVYPTRYRWVEDGGNHSSEGCGWRKDEQGQWVRWRQALYAVNISHTVEDSKLDYPYVKPGTPVMMFYARLSNLDDYNGGTGWGFAFIHKSDPPGTQLCPTGAQVGGCCILTDSQGFEIKFCATEQECEDFNNPPNSTVFLGLGVSCPGNDPPCSAGGGSIPAGDPAAFVPPIGSAAPAVRLVTPWHKIAGSDSASG